MIDAQLLWDVTLDVHVLLPSRSALNDRSGFAFDRHDVSLVSGSACPSLMTGDESDDDVLHGHHSEAARWVIDALMPCSAVQATFQRWMLSSW